MSDRLRPALSLLAAILISAVFLIAGLWKLTDPTGAAARLAQARVPESLSLAAALALGIAETFAGAMFLVPRFRRWAAALGTLLLVAFTVFIGIHYNELRGAECSCFPWVKRAVGPAFFIGDFMMILVAAAAGALGIRSRGILGAASLLAAIVVFAGASFAFNTARQHGTKAPDTIAAEDGHPISLRYGKTFIYFFNPQCLHCLEAGRRLAALNWGTTRFVGVATENPRFADWFMGKAGLSGKGPVSTDLNILKKTFPFDVPPAGVALENGYQKAMLLQFEDAEPKATLRRLGFAQ